MAAENDIVSKNFHMLELKQSFTVTLNDDIRAVTINGLKCGYIGDVHSG